MSSTTTTNDNSNGLKLLAAAAANELRPKVFLSREKRCTKKKSVFDETLIVNFNKETNDLWIRTLKHVSFQLYTPTGGRYRWCIKSRDLTKTFPKEIELRAGTRRRFVFPVRQNVPYDIKVQYFNRASSWVDCEMVYNRVFVKLIRQTTSLMWTEKRARMEFITSQFKRLQTCCLGETMMYHLKRRKNCRVINLTKLQQVIFRGVDDALLNVPRTSKVVICEIVNRTLPYVFESIRQSIEEIAEKTWKQKLKRKAIMKFDRFLRDESKTVFRYLSKLRSFDKKTLDFLLHEYKRFTKTK
jgi:hypothetical protein